MKPLEDLLDVMARLRDPERGCPWDVKQTFDTIAPYTIEEAYEVADAIQRNDLEDLRDELGDLLFQVVFHARMAEEHGHFAFPDVAAAIRDKIVRRHPHVFEQARVDDVSVSWEAIKAEERARKLEARGEDVSALSDVSVALPGLLRAVKLTRRAARVGFDWPEARGVLEKIREELDEVEEAYRQTPERQDLLEEELGDLLFATANLARHLKLDPEAALRRANAKFESRFRHMERALGGQGLSLDRVDFERREQAWEAAKREERRIQGNEQ
ncbi:MAG: nucleoside triphosphate pyrophosphohydrolase [Ectothiorhodospiraceae bacterium]|nr:nucleoside triphosphate pyrophosphohydrolase [Ectothiorhodospiraceae bacterium]